jgi:hypothetical protein
MAVAALVVGIVGTVIALIPFAFSIASLLGVLAVSFGFVGRGQARRMNNGGGMSMAGLILGFVAIGLAMVGAAIDVAIVSNNNAPTPATSIPSTPAPEEPFVPTTGGFQAVSASDSKLAEQTCGVDEFGIAKATGTITNLSGRAYMFTIGVVFEDSSGNILGLGEDYKYLLDGETATYDTGTRCRPERPKSSAM